MTKSSDIELPTLYKRTSTGKIQYWKIFTQGKSIVTRYGQVGGKEQETIDVIKSGKNTGRKNQTTAEQQARSEAQSRHDKQLKKGYVESIEDAESGKVDKIIVGGISPMLAHKYSEQADKIEWPAYIQPKLDGHRCIAMIDESGKATLWTRTRKPITGVPHINRALEQSLAQYAPIVLDGELYTHSYRNDFERITSFVRQETPAPGHHIVQYHVYDIAGPGAYEERELRLKTIWYESGLHAGTQDPLVLVSTFKIGTEEDLMEKFEFFLQNGYEGAMVRNGCGKYVGRRSGDLLKVKEFLDDEFEVVGVEAGRGKMADKAIFVCKTDAGTEFRVKMKGDLDELKKYLENPSLAIGKMLTVQYQGVTGANKVPRFPVGLRLFEEV